MHRRADNTVLLHHSSQGDGSAGRAPKSEKKGLRQRIKNSEVVFGPFIKLSCPQVVEIAGRAGFDFVILDTEHAPLTAESVENLVRAAEVAGTSPIVRVYENRPALISRCLDVGAQGILVPHISNKEQAEALAKAARFAPKGERGVCCYVRAAQFSQIDRYRYFDEANDNTIVVAMIEGKEGIANLDEILLVPGLDVIFIGPYDLSQSLGVAGQVTSPEVVGEMQRVAKKAQAHGLAVGTFVDDVADAKKWMGLGVQLISYSVDVGIIYKAMRDVIAALRPVDQLSS